MHSPNELISGLQHERESTFTVIPNNSVRCNKNEYSLKEDVFDDLLHPALFQLCDLYLGAVLFGGEVLPLA